MELRRKEHAIRQVSKQMSYMESEKNALVDRLNDAEKSMTAAARLVEWNLLPMSRNFARHQFYSFQNEKVTTFCCTRK